MSSSHEYRPKFWNEIFSDELGFMKKEHTFGQVRFYSPRNKEILIFKKFNQLINLNFPYQLHGHRNYVIKDIGIDKAFVAIQLTFKIIILGKYP